MENLLSQLVNDLNKGKQGHIFYHFNDIEKYLQNALFFITSVVNQGSHMMLVENDRNLIYLKNNLKKQLSEEQFNRIHFMNNFDFYYSNGDFHAQTIFEYFKSSVEPFIESDKPLCTWGLIEWSDEHDITQNIEEYETDVDMHIKDKAVISVCAYDAKRTPERLKETLIRIHGIMLTDHQVHYIGESKAI